MTKLEITSEKTLLEHLKNATLMLLNLQDSVLVNLTSPYRLKRAYKSLFTGRGHLQQLVKEEMTNTVQVFTALL